MTLKSPKRIADELRSRLTHGFLRDEKRRQPVCGREKKIQTEPHCKDHILFNEYCTDENGRGMGVLHQTVRAGWPSRRSRSCMNRSTRSVSGDRLNMVT